MKKVRWFEVLVIILLILQLVFLAQISFKIGNDQGYDQENKKVIRATGLYKAIYLTGPGIQRDCVKICD